MTRLGKAGKNFFFGGNLHRWLHLHDNASAGDLVSLLGNTHLRKRCCSSATASAWCPWSAESMAQSFGRSWPGAPAASRRTAAKACRRGPRTAPQTTWKSTKGGAVFWFEKLISVYYLCGRTKKNKMTELVVWKKQTAIWGEKKCKAHDQNQNLIPFMKYSGMVSLLGTLCLLRGWTHCQLPKN